MKKLLTLLLAVGFSLAFVACGNQAKEEAAATDETTEMEEAPAQEEMTEEEAPAQEEMTEEADTTQVESE